MNEEKSEQRQPVYAYKKAWKVEKKIYGFGNIHMPVPVSLKQAGYFLISLGLLYLLCLLPVLSGIPAIMKYAILPYILSVVIDKKKLDGKNPARFLIDFVKFSATKKQQIERFSQKDPQKDGEISFNNWWISVEN